MFMASQCRGAGTQVAHCLPWPARPTRRPSCLLGTVATSGRASPAGAPCAAGVSGGIQHRQQAPIAQHDGIQPAVRVGQPGGRHGHPARSVRVAYREHDSAIDIVVVLDRTIPQPKQHPHIPILPHKQGALDNVALIQHLGTPHPCHPMVLARFQVGGPLGPLRAALVAGGRQDGAVWQLQRLVLGGPQQPVAQSLGAPPRAPAILGHLSPADPQLLVLARLVKQGNVPREGVFEEHRVPERAAPGVLRHPVCRPPGTRLRLRRIVREARHPDACPVHPLPLAAKPRGDHLSRRCLHERASVLAVGGPPVLRQHPAPAQDERRLAAQPSRRQHSQRRRDDHGGHRPPAGPYQRQHSQGDAHGDGDPQSR
mmetsp:Transcript_19593/g.49298  ORF Transcript_19593/g.49298 Transcript_19593/m.49298 type:complete len:369 (+) Transcript_19593:540-1646(+)